MQRLLSARASAREGVFSPAATSRGRPPLVGRRVYSLPGTDVYPLHPPACNRQQGICAHVSEVRPAKRGPPEEACRTLARF